MSMYTELGPKTWLDRRPGREMYEPVSTETRTAIRDWLPVVADAFRRIVLEPDQGPKAYMPFAERCCIGAHADEHLHGPALSKLRADAYATCRHHVAQSIAVWIVSSGAPLPIPGSGRLVVYQPDNAPPREYMDDTDPERPTPTVCYFVRWAWEEKVKALPSGDAPKLNVGWDFALEDKSKVLPQPRGRILLQDSKVIDV